ncbi:putative phosphatase YwpJ [compost metagenome]
MQGVALSQKSLLKLTHFTEQLGAYIQLYGYNKLYVPELNERNSAWPMANVVVSPNKELTEENYADQTRHIEVIPVGDLSTFISSIQCIELPVYKATVISDNPELIDELLFMLEGIHEYTLTKTGRHRFDVNALGVSKRSALQQLCRQLQITHNEVAAVGDYDNDAEMLSWAGLGVAMGNAEPHVKEIADVITASNENDGVAQAIMNHLL